MTRRRYARYFTFAIFVATALTTGCGSDPVEPGLLELRAAPLIVSIGQHSYRLETFIWRDLSPRALPADDSGLIASLTLVERNSLAIPEAVELTRAWVIRGDGEIWSTVPRQESESAAPYKLERMARNGPTWEPLIRVSVVVDVTIGQTSALLKAVDQKIDQAF